MSFQIDILVYGKYSQTREQLSDRLLPNKLPIIHCYYLIPNFIPFRVFATPQTFDDSLTLKILKHPTDHVDADARIFLYDIGHTEIAGKTIDCPPDHHCLLTPLRRQAAQPFLEFPVRALEDETDEVDVMPGVVLAFMPSFRTLFQCFVVSFLVLLDQPFETDVSSDLDPQRRKKMVSIHAPAWGATW